MRKRTPFRRPLLVAAAAAGAAALVIAGGAPPAAAAGGPARFDASALEPLFDGKTLDGFVTRGGRYDGDAVWTVEDGAIVGREGRDHAGGLLYTERPYQSFLLSLEAKVDFPFDSGIFLRMSPRGRGAQVTIDNHPTGEIGAIYSDEFLAHNETARTKLFRQGEWNRFEVRCTGLDMRIEAWLNGEKIADTSVPRGSAGFAPAGLIGLQVHGGRDDPEGAAARFRDIRVKELPLFDLDLFECDDAGALSPTPKARSEGWTPLFDGKALAGFETTGDPDGYRVRDSMLVFPKKGSDAYVRTAEDFRDFSLRLDFKISRMANSGLFLRGDRNGGNPAYTGCEVQILDDFNWERVTGSKLEPWQFTGSLYAAVPPADRGAMNPIGMWNTIEVTYRGSRIATRLNGRLLYDVDTFAVEASPPFSKRVPRGFIGLQRHAPPEVEGEEYAWFRNIWVKRLPDQKEAKSGE